MRKVFKDGIFPSDIGCYTLGLQLGAVDTTICMGASITIASGISHSGEEHEVVATIGDSTFLHAGIPGLLNAVYNGARMILIILPLPGKQHAGSPPPRYRWRHYAGHAALHM
jgi:indolepyruvate ferredoxin oxidoreductase alpha subunit